MTEVRVWGAWFGDADLLVLRLMDAPRRPADIIADAVAGGLSENMARTTLERLWGIAAVEHDTRRMSRTNYGDAILEAADNARPHRLRSGGPPQGDTRAQVVRERLRHRDLRHLRARLLHEALRLPRASREALLGGPLAHHGGDAPAGEA